MNLVEIKKWCKWTICQNVFNYWDESSLWFWVESRTVHQGVIYQSGGFSLKLKDEIHDILNVNSLKLSVRLFIFVFVAFNGNHIIYL